MSRAGIVPLHSSLGNKRETLSQKNKTRQKKLRKSTRKGINQAEMRNGKGVNIWKRRSKSEFPALEGTEADLSWHKRAKTEVENHFLTSLKNQKTDCRHAQLLES